MIKIISKKLLFVFICLKIVILRIKCNRDSRELVLIYLFSGSKMLTFLKSKGVFSLMIIDIFERLYKHLEEKKVSEREIFHNRNLNILFADLKKHIKSLMKTVICEKSWKICLQLVNYLMICKLFKSLSLPRATVPVAIITVIIHFEHFNKDLKWLTLRTDGRGPK